MVVKKIYVKNTQKNLLLSERPWVRISPGTPAIYRGGFEKIFRVFANENKGPLDEILKSGCFSNAPKWPDMACLLNMADGFMLSGVYGCIPVLFFTKSWKSDRE